MKTVIETPVVFNPANRTLDFSSVAGFSVTKLLTIINLDAKKIMYVVGKNGLGYSSLAGSVVTLQMDTTAMSANDRLTILYESSFDFNSIVTALQDIKAELKDDFFIQSQLWEDRSSQTAVFYREERKFSQDDGSVTVTYTRSSDGQNVANLPAGSIPVNAVGDRQIEIVRWKVKAGVNKPSYSALDYLVQILVFDSAGSGSLLANFWVNLITGLTIAAPVSADIESTEAGLLNQIIAQNEIFKTNWEILKNNKLPDMINSRMPVTQRDTMELLGTFNVNTANNFFATIDVTQYKEITVVLSGVFTGFMQVYQCLDGVNALGSGLLAKRMDTTTAASNTSMSTVGAYRFPVMTPFFKLYSSVLSTGTMIVTVYANRTQSFDSIIQAIIPSALPPGTNQIGNVALLASANTIGLVTLNASSNVIGYVKQVASTGGKIIAAATTNAQVLRASAGVLTFVTATNRDSVVCALKIYDKATAPVVGTDVPKHTILIPANPLGGGNNPSIVVPVTFSAGIAIALTPTESDVDANPLPSSAAGKVVINYAHQAA